MPYIPEQDRRKFDSVLLELTRVIGLNGISAGELNYLITSLAKFYLERHGVSYSIINDIVGILECAKQEFYRRVAAPYEDKKIKLNKDVY